MEGLEEDVDLLLEQLAVCFLIDQGRTERLDLARVIAAPDSEGDAAAAEDIGHGVVFGEAQRMPHGRNVEAAAKSQPFGLVREMQRHHENIGDAFRSLALEMVLGHPERVETVRLHHLGLGLGLCERGRQVLVGIAARIDRRALVAAILEIGMTCVQAVELGDHEWLSPVGIGGNHAAGCAFMRVRIGSRVRRSLPR